MRETGEAYIIHVCNGDMTEPMTFKTRPHRYSIGPAPTNRARCRGCRQIIYRGSLRVAIRVFVRPGRGTTFVRHTSAACMDASLAKNVLSARAKGEVSVGVGVGVDAVAAVWGVMERACETPSRRRGQAEREVGSANQPIISSMLCNLNRGQAGGSEQKEDSVGEEAWVRTGDVWCAGAGVHGACVECES